MRIIQRRFPAITWVAAAVTGVTCLLYSAAATAQPDGIQLAQAADAPPATPSSPEAAKAQDSKLASAPTAASTGKPVFPSVIDPKYSREVGPLGRMRTCADQFNANKATNANAGLKWIDRSGGYYLQCSKHLKG